MSWLKIILSNTIDLAKGLSALLGAAFYENDNHGSYFGGATIIFDTETFNQDIYITNSAPDTATSANYYVELEQVNLDLTENTVATLKDIRNIESNR